MIARSKQILAWFGRWNTLWFFLGFVLIAVAISDWIGCNLDIPREERLPYAGWFLEVLGVSVVLLGIGDRLRLFNKPGIMSRAKALLREFPLRTQNHIAKLATGELNLVGELATVHITQHPPPDASLKDRIELLELQVNRLQDTINTKTEKSKEAVADLERRLKQEISTVRQDLAAVQSQSESAHLNQLGWEYVGLGWIIVGLTLATVPRLVLWSVGPIVGYLEVIPC